MRCGGSFFFSFFPPLLNLKLRVMFLIEVHLAVHLSAERELTFSLDNLGLHPTQLPNDKMNYIVYCQSALIILAPVRMTEHCSGGPRQKNEHLSYNGPRIALSELH